MEELIDKSLADEAYAIVTILKNNLKTKEEVFRFLAAMNLLNSYVKKDYADEEYKKRYIIKSYVMLAVTQIIENKIQGVNLFVDDGIVYIKVLERQFSFHNVNLNSTIKAFKNSKKNLRQEWEGIRLQPICVTIFEEAKKKQFKSKV